MLFSVERIFCLVVASGAIDSLLTVLTVILALLLFMEPVTFRRHIQTMLRPYAVACGPVSGAPKERRNSRIAAESEWLKGNVKLVGRFQSLAEISQKCLLDD